MEDSGLYKKLYGGRPQKQQSTASAPESAGSQGSGDPFQQAAQGIRQGVDPEQVKKRLGSLFK